LQIYLAVQKLIIFGTVPGNGLEKKFIVCCVLFWIFTQKACTIILFKRFRYGATSTGL
jgi:hypothetical protein